MVGLVEALSDGLSPAFFADFLFQPGGASGGRCFLEFVECFQGEDARGDLWEGLSFGGPQKDCLPGGCLAQEEGFGEKFWGNLGEGGISSSEVAHGLTSVVLECQDTREFFVGNLVEASVVGSPVGNGVPKGRGTRQHGEG